MTYRAWWRVGGGARQFGEWRETYDLANEDMWQASYRTAYGPVTHKGVESNENRDDAIERVART